MEPFYDGVSVCNAVWSAKCILIRPLHVQIYSYKLQAEDRPHHSSSNVSSTN